MAATWTLQDAKNRFSAIVDAAQAGEPQLVTKRGRPAVVIVDADEFARLRDDDAAKNGAFVEHLLAMPRCEVSFERLSLDPRDAGLDEDLA
jgi:prevent-host-death family protein